MQLKPLTRDEVMIRLIAEPEFLPVESNASATDDDALDREIAQGILRRLDQVMYGLGHGHRNGVLGPVLRFRLSWWLLL